MAVARSVLTQSYHFIRNNEFHLRIRAGRSCVSKIPEIGKIRFFRSGERCRNQFIVRCTGIPCSRI